MGTILPLRIRKKKYLSIFNLLSLKPKIIVCNVDEESLQKGNRYTETVKLEFPNEKVINICADIEDQIMSLDKSERQTFMKEIGLNKTGLNQLIKEGYDLLNLDTFFTSGPEESRAWTIEKNTLAPQAARVIHTDFEKILLEQKLFRVKTLLNLEVLRSVKKTES